MGHDEDSNEHKEAEADTTSTWGMLDGMVQDPHVQDLIVVETTNKSGS